MDKAQRQKAQRHREIVDCRMRIAEILINRRARRERRDKTINPQGIRKMENS